jgi:hypothetical protein
VICTTTMQKQWTRSEEQEVDKEVSAALPGVGADLRVKQEADRYCDCSNSRDATGQADLWQQLLTLRHDCTVSLSVSEGGPGGAAAKHTRSRVTHEQH